MVWTFEASGAKSFRTAALTSAAVFRVTFWSSVKRERRSVSETNACCFRNNASK